MSDKFGCDRCYNTQKELYPCERCDDLLCVDCESKHKREEHLYPIHLWRKAAKQINSLTACCIIAASILIWQFPVLVIPPVSVSVLTPTILAHQLEVEHAAKEADSVLKNYSCDRDVVYAIARHAVARNVPSRIVAATVAIESSCRADAVSKAGAVGLMQVMPLHKVQNAVSPENNIAAGTSILSENIHKYGKREGIKRYFGVSGPNTTKADEYADKVIMLAAKGE